MADTVFSFVIPVFNEEAVIPLLLRRMERLLAAVGEPAEVIFVDDGSSDSSPTFLANLARGDERYCYLRLARNFGHQIAITAGLEAARGKAVIIMDADLQDPPETVLAMIAEWRKGFEVVHAQRISRAAETPLKRVTAHLFYRLINRLSAIDIPRDVGDFRLVDRVAVDAFLQLPEANRYVRGMFAWIGFRQTVVQYEREARAAGVSKYPLRKMLSLATSAIISFSDAPLRLAIWIGAVVSAASLAYGGYALLRALFWSNGLVDGWASTVVVISLLSGVNMLLTGVVGLYVGRIHAEVKGRPLYIVSRKIGFEAEAVVAPRVTRRASA
ncbi:dolichol-phosphate mannosyltransferase [Devosia sp. YR412]|uniref:glycosyltransferase family 2 protein n=1 Tax=Devosia sp. YR412 TaxID=1881030 RepID=UPI0008C157E2|nr:glycosyltransferase family 2 protein [Devosia sp. YR412]SEP97391.1 dolichol-phosphate mannosyltransferase [Devosia sp. YR412]